MFWNLVAVLIFMVWVLPGLVFLFAMTVQAISDFVDWVIAQIKGLFIQDE